MSQDEKHALVSCLWPHLKGQPRVASDENYEQYLSFVSGELAELERCKDDFAAQNFHSMFAIIEQLRGGATKSEIAQILQNQFLNVQTTVVMRSMELAARLWLTIDVRSTGYDVGPVHPEDESLHWSNDINLRTAVQMGFDEIGATENADTRIKNFDPSLSVINLVNFQGIRVCWTDNLLDHLRLESESLFIYRHKMCLENHLRSGSVGIVPAAVLEEAIDTLNLLFARDWRTRAFLNTEKQSFYSVGNCGREIVYAIEHYRIWSGRLLALSDLADRQPSTLRQLWMNRRNVDRWFAFWSQTCSIAVAVIGIVITTIASVVGTFYTAKQYEIARAQACLVPDAKVSLPRYCG